MKTLLFFLLWTFPLYAIELTAKQAYLIDLSTNTVLYAKNETERTPPSSMTKIWTTYMVFKKLKEGKLHLNDTLTVSKKAWKTGGSKMFVEVEAQVSIDDLLKGIIVQSGNDACVVVAEGLGGTEESFAQEMTEEAHALGATDTQFMNASGLPDEGHYSSAKDLALLAQRLILEFPEYYKQYYPLTEFTYSGITQPNRNPLLAKNLGDGMKTGFTDAGGYGLIGSAEQNGRRLLFVINGAPSSSARAQDAEAFIKWGFREFQSITFFKAGDVVEKADVWGGEQPSVALTVTGPLLLTLPRQDAKKIKVTVSYNGPLSAPFKKGTQVGQIKIEMGNTLLKAAPLIAAQDIERAGFFKRISNAFHYILWGYNK